MRFVESPIAGAFVVELEPLVDSRGSFTRLFDASTFAAHGLAARVLQASVSHNADAGVLRGLHFQAQPHGEAKLVRCARGALYDVIVDVRRDSPTHRRWFALELSPTAQRALYVPPGVAHGFQTLLDDTEVQYQMDAPHVPGAARGVRWDDPAFAIAWPEPPPGGRRISPRDAALPDYTS
jgi:dTDP-4-dehydrorhamnose 3,5-epimerase